MTARRFFISLICVVLISPVVSEAGPSQSAWQELVRQNPAVVDDRSIDWRERLILDVLTPEQARHYYQGTSPEELVLESGQTLAEYLAARTNPPGSVYIPLPGSCEVLTLQDVPMDETIRVQVRGLCGMPEEATAVILQITAESMGAYPRVKLWASDLPEPAEAVVEGNSVAFEGLKTTTAVVTLCTGDRCRGGGLQIKGSDIGRVQAEAVGYFRPFSAADRAETGSGILFSTESTSNNFFGTGAGSSITTGYYNSFFGGDAGKANTTGNSNSFFGYGAGSLNTTSSGNSFFGWAAGHFNTSGDSNSFFGYGSGYENTAGEDNSFFGYRSGYENTTGHDNAFFGSDAGHSNTEGNYNSFFGCFSGAYNNTGSNNSCFGYQSGFFNTTGQDNSFFGRDAGYSNTTGNSNAFFGRSAGRSNTTALDNAFFGADAGFANTTGHRNAFFGRLAGFSNTTGSWNAFFGRSAGHFNTTGSSNVFIGYTAGYSNTEGDYNAFVGYQSGSSNTTGDFNSFFGYQAGNSNTNGIGNSFLGPNAGNSNTTGTANSFFGAGAGFSSISGLYNSFFGWTAGYFNTTGSNNSFFGRDAGFSNTVENYNTFVGCLSDLDPGSDPGISPVTNATAIGNRSYVSQSNSLVLGSINGVNGAAASTQVGIGTTAPQRLLHIAGDNAVFRMDRSTNSAAFMLVRTNSSGGVLKNFVVGVDASGTNQGEFIINDLGTALGGPGQRRLTINNDGDVIINGDLITNAGPLSFPDYVFEENYELMPLGELREYVETQKHLPDIPSAEAIEEQGEINVTELQLKLLQKIEELTLYAIKQQETIDLQQVTIERLTDRLGVLENEGSGDR